MKCTPTLPLAALAFLLPALLACELPARQDATARAGPPAAAGRLVISEVMADPSAVPDERGEWVEIANPGAEPVELRGWKLLSGNDAGLTVAQSVVVPPGGAVVLGRDGRTDANGGVRVDYRVAEGLTLANSGDWIALRDPLGAPVDSVAWTQRARRGASWTRTSPAPDLPVVEGPGWKTAEERFGAGDRGTPGRVEFVVEPAGGASSPTAVTAAADDDASTGDTGPTEGRSAAIYRDHVAFGLPTDGSPADDYLIRRPQYVLSYNPRRGVANWVAWNLNRTHFGDVPRSPSFQADPTLPERFPRILSSDYTGSGYSRGHLVRSEERTATAEDNAATFLMTNVIPQHQDLNGGPWLDLERHLQDEAQRRGREIYVIAGGTFTADPPTLRDRGRVQIPEATWKIAVLLPLGAGLDVVRSADDVEVIAVEMPNTAGLTGQRWTRYRTTVDALELATGYDFLDRLPDEVERVLEARR